THNVEVSIMCFALGFALGLPTAFLLVQNGVMMGALIAVYAQHHLGLNLIGWLMIHGTTELFAIILAGAAGFRIGLSAIFPGAHTRMASAAQAGRATASVMIGVMLMLLVSGMLEGIARQLVSNDLARYGVGLAMLTLWLVYFYAPRRLRAVPR
ncbi:MAG: stage II sporulation protein M, partial [Alphaproteobacteria bacterium]|nr:stage II sporulation protein M [Alphaproteobacteria bacterium]